MPKPTSRKARPPARENEPAAALSGWSGERVARFRSELLDFFGERRRPLPWRADRDPYRVLVSEVMLQQTRVDTVAPYFARWVEKFPDFHSLARAEEEEVLKLWAGLGYYSRARRLLETVREVVARYDGALPESVEELEGLPGIGPYTAGAIASIAFGAPVPAVDGNVRRVLSRLADVGSPTPRELAGWAGELVDPNDPGGFNQALMELGSLICLPRNPRCTECSVAEFCASRAAGTQHLRPTPPKRRPPPLIHEAVAICVSGSGADERFLLRRRPPEGLLGGMWEFPGVEVDGSAAAGATDPILQLDRALKLDRVAHPLPLPIPLDTLEHIFSHRRVRYIPFLFRAKKAGRLSDPALRWVTAAEADELPLPAAQRKLLSRVSRSTSTSSG